MDIRELDKKQLVLLTLLITFVVSIATGIVTVSLMNQMPKSVPQTINNVIQRTIEKVTTVQVPTPTPASNTTTDNSTTGSKDDSISLLGNGEALVPIYIKNTSISTPPTDGIGNTATDTSGSTDGSSNEAAIGQGVIVSDIGLILVDSSLIKDGELYKVVLNKIDFDTSVLKKFDNGFTILKISPITNNTPESTNTTSQTQ